MASSVFSDRVLMRSRSRFDHAARFKYRVPPSRAERDQSENQKMAPVNTHQNQTSDATLKGWLYMCQTRSKTESKDTNVDGKHRKKTQRKSRSLGARDDKQSQKQVRPKRAGASPAVAGLAVSQDASPNGESGRSALGCCFGIRLARAGWGVQCGS